MTLHRTTTPNGLTKRPDPGVAGSEKTSFGRQGVIMITDYFSLAGKKALITGAGKGIGARIATAYAEMGCTLRWLLEQAISTLSPKRLPHWAERRWYTPATFRMKRHWRRLPKTLSALGRPGYSVNNAGAPGKGYGSLSKVTKARFEHTLDINHLSLHPDASAHRCFATRQKPRSSTWSALGWMVDRNCGHGAAKAGMDQMTRILAYELAPGIRVNGIAPGVRDT